MIPFIQILLPIILTLVSLEIWYRKREKHYPPGPQPLPVIGNMLNLAPNPLKSLPKLHEKYGKILALDFGYYRTVLINDGNLVRELYQMEASNGAPPVLGMVLDRSPSGKPLGILTMDGDEHTEVLRLLRKSAKALTESIPVIDDILLESTDVLIESFDAAADSGEQISSHHCFYHATLNTVWRWITGERADPRDPMISEILTIVQEFFKYLGSGIMSFFFPWLCKIAPELSGWSKVEKRNSQIVTYISNTMKTHARTLATREQRMGNLMDAFQEAIENNAEPSSGLYKDLGYLNARATYVALLYGGIETTAATLTWALLYMLKTAGAQEKLQEEIDETIGRDRRPSVSDRSRMAYTMSFLTETFRIAPVGPLGVPRRLTQDIHFHGHILRKDTIIIQNIYGFHHDPTVWGTDSDEFRAERFLNESPSKSSRASNLLNFGSGKRACPGEPIARQQIFVVFVSLLQRYHFYADNVESIGSEGDVTRQAFKPFPFCFKVQRRAYN